MAVEPMKYISVLGPLPQFEKFVLKYIINGNIQLEPAMKCLNIRGLIPFEDSSPYDMIHKRLRALNERMKVKVKQYDPETVNEEVLGDLPLDVVNRFISRLEDRIESHKRETEALRSEIQEHEQIINQIKPFTNVDVNFEDLFSFSFMKFRFGSMPKINFIKQKEYLDEMDVIYVPVAEENEIIWLSYFMPSTISPVIDNVFSSLGFERVRISDQVKGMPRMTLDRLQKEISLSREKIRHAEEELEKFLDGEREAFEELYNKILYLSKISEVKAMAAYTKETFFLVGWIPASDYKTFESQVETMDEIILSSEDPDYVVNSSPPTILKNHKLIKPFEGLLTMYGLPSAKEIDPTPLLTITYVIMFGFMFGDVGQGALIALLGAYLFFARKMLAAGVLIYVGISSFFFGFVYGSVFGSEEIIHPLWVSPLHSKDTINTILYVALAYGALTIIITIIANIINCIKLKRWGKLIFDKNGIAGLLFYGGLVTCVALSLKEGRIVFGLAGLFVVIILPALLLVFKEPLENLIMHRDHIMPHEKGIYFVEAGFDLFETVLSFFSSTVSFVRVGAFALSHAGLSLAVWTLVNMMKGAGGIIVIILGNALTIGLEGLIVGIQCMRLEYYEMFGRFYAGEGSEFKPIKVKDE